MVKGWGNHIVVIRLVQGVGGRWEPPAWVYLKSDVEVVVTREGVAYLGYITHSRWGSIRVNTWQGTELMSMGMNMRGKKFRFSGLPR